MDASQSSGNDPFANGSAHEPRHWVAHYGDFLYRYAFSRLRSADAAEEAVQETFLAGLRNLDQYAGQGPQRAWLLGILKRKIIDIIRVRQRKSFLRDDDVADSSDASFDARGNWQRDLRRARHEPLDSLERQEFWRILSECLETLNPRQADVFVLREMDNLTTKEICEELEITSANLWVILSRARLQLSQCMKQRWRQDRGS